MIKALDLPAFFGAKKKEYGGIASLKASTRIKNNYNQVRPLWLYSAYLLIALNAAVLFSYLLGVNQAASTGYEIQKIQEKIATISDQSKKLNLQISQQTSIAQIQNDFLNSGYVPVGLAQFLQVNRFTER